MVNFIEFIVFIIFNIYVLYQSLIYGIYEFKELNNKFGGTIVVIFSFLTSILSIFSLISA